MSQGVAAAAGRNGEPDTFVEGTEMLLLKHVLATAAVGQPESVMAAIDKFGWDTRWVMCLGDVKGKFLDDAINSVQPCANILELGLYCGYSATRMARLLPPGGKVTTIEPSELHRNVASQVIAKAGLADKVDILPGYANEVIPALAERGVQFDLVFIDHHKDSYLPDLKLLEQHGLLREGAVVVADNVVVFKLDAYLEHVRSSGKYSSSTLHMAHIEYSNDRPDGVEVSVYAG